MPGRKASTREELTGALEARVATVRHERHERYLHFLRLALRIRLDNGYPAGALPDVIKQGEDEFGVLTERIGGMIFPRQRPPAVDTNETCTVFMDECGAHSLRAKDKFGAFCLAAIIIRDRDFPLVDRQWKRWKRDYLGSSRKRVHEPDIRDERSSFWCDGSAVRRAKAVRALDGILGRLDFTGIACVLHRTRYLAQIGNQPLDESLPQHPYLMTMHFMAERVALALSSEFNGARARVVMESRGPLEDANLQYAFARLFIDGTSYVSATWFRHQFFPGLEFRDKFQNSTGLQLADLLARPCAEKVLDPDSMPARWPVLKRKLCPGQETKHSIIGLKIVPWEDRYLGIWER